MASARRHRGQRNGRRQDATQIGTSTGLLGDVVEVLRLNTVGGVAPAGVCDPQATPIVNVPYQADYVFING